MRVCYIQLKQLDDGEEWLFPPHEFWTIRSGGLWENVCEEYKHLMI